VTGGKKNFAQNSFLLSTYEIWKVFTCNFFLIANFHVFGFFIPKKRVESEKKCPSVGVAGIAGVAVGF
jgi:hypothetical protein